MPLPPVLAVASAIGSWLLCDFHRIGAFEGDGGIRGVALVASFVGGALLGALLDLRVVRRTWVGTALALVVALPALGVAVAVASSGHAWRRDTVATGALSALALLPTIALSLHLRARVGRARALSLVDDADRRGPWVVVAATLALGAALALLGAPRLVGAAWRGQEITVAIAALSAIVLVGALFADVRAWRVAGDFARALSDLRPRDADALEELEAPLRVDLGIGDGASERIQRQGDAYRRLAVIDAIVIGDPIAADLALRGAAARSACGLAAALAGLGAAISWA